MSKQKLLVRCSMTLTAFDASTLEGVARSFAAGCAHRYSFIFGFGVVKGVLEKLKKISREEIKLPSQSLGKIV